MHNYAGDLSAERALHKKQTHVLSAASTYNVHFIVLSQYDRVRAIADLSVLLVIT